MKEQVATASTSEPGAVATGPGSTLDTRLVTKSEPRAVATGHTDSCSTVFNSGSALEPIPPSSVNPD